MPFFILLLAVLAKATVAFDEPEWLYNGDPHGTQLGCSSEHEHGSNVYGCTKALDALDMSSPGGYQDTFFNSDADLGSQYITFDFGEEYVLFGFREMCYPASWPGTGAAVKGLVFAHADSPDGNWRNVENMDPTSGSQACDWNNRNTFTFTAVSSRYWRLKIISNFQTGYGTSMAKIQFQGMKFVDTGNACTCANGTAATGYACTSDSSAICVSCNEGYNLSGLSCIEHVVSQWGSIWRDTANCDILSAIVTSCLDSPFTDACAHGVGVNTGANKIPDSAITASSCKFNTIKSSGTGCASSAGCTGTAYDVNAVGNGTCVSGGSEPSLARLDNQGATWHPLELKQHEHIQYDLGEVRLVVGMKTQGAFYTTPTGTDTWKGSAWEDFRVWYSHDAMAWRDGGTYTHPYLDNYRGWYQDVSHTLDTNYQGMSGLIIRARYIRLQLLKAWRDGGMQAEFFGPQCQVPPLQPVGMKSFRLPDRDIMTGGCRYTPPCLDVRLDNAGNQLQSYLEDRNGSGIAWIRVDLKIIQTVLMVGMQGSTDHWLGDLTQFKVSGSADGQTFNEESGEISVTNTGWPRRETTQWSDVDITGRYIRVTEVARAQNKAISIRFELMVAVDRFDWTSAVPVLAAIPVSVSDPIFCNASNHALQANYLKWNDGTSADGIDYRSDPVTLAVANGDHYSATAYQRRSMYGRSGAIVKSVTCYVGPIDGQASSEKCCVQKSASDLAQGVWRSQKAAISLA